MPTEIYRIKMNEFWINGSYSPLHYARQTTKKSNMPKMRKMPSNHNKSNFKNHRNRSLSTAQTSGISIAIHSNSIAGSVLMFTTKPRYWIWMNSYWNVRSPRDGKGAFSVILEKGLVVIWRHLSNFWHIRFLWFLTWVMRRTVANFNKKIIHFDEVDFSGHHSEKI